MMMKKVSDKKVLGGLLMMELKKDVRFKKMSLEKALKKIESLRKEKSSYLSDRAYSLFIAYKNGMSVFKKYVSRFEDEVEILKEKTAAKVSHYRDLIMEFTRIVNDVKKIKSVEM